MYYNKSRLCKGNDIVNRLKFLRTEKKENLYKIAKFLNVSIQTVSNYENEKREMTPDTIIKLAEYFGGGGHPKAAGFCLDSPFYNKKEFKII